MATEPPTPTPSEEKLRSYPSRIAKGDTRIADLAECKAFASGVYRSSLENAIQLLDQCRLGLAPGAAPEIQSELIKRIGRYFEGFNYGEVTNE